MQKTTQKTMPKTLPELNSTISRIVLFLFITLLFSCGQPPSEPAQEAGKEPAQETQTAAQTSSSVDTQSQTSGVLAKTWQEGVHYTVFSDEATEQREVLEFFSYWCPACYGFEPIVDEIKANLNSDVNFGKVHVYFMRFTTPEIQNEATTAMLIGHTVGEFDKYSAAIFEHIHQQRKSVGGLNDLRNLFIAQGMTPSTFDNAANSEEIAALLKQNNDNIDRYREQVTSVPTLIINGKYKPIFNREMTIDDIVELVNWLAEQN